MSELQRLSDSPELLDGEDAALLISDALRSANHMIEFALEMGNVDMMVEIRSRAEALAKYAEQKQYGEQIIVGAREIVRRAERGTAQVIKAGQEADPPIYRSKITAGKDWRNEQLGQVRDPNLPKPQDPVAAAGYKAKSQLADIRPLGNATDEEFETALERARPEGMTRAAVVRQLRPDKLKEQQRKKDDDHYKRRKLDSARIVRETVLGSVVSAELLHMVDYASLDLHEINEWIEMLTHNIRELQALKVRLAREQSERETDDA